MAASVGALAALLMVLLTSPASAASRPGSVSGVDAGFGSKVGTIKVTWHASGSHTSRFRIQTSLDPDGRATHTFYAKSSQRSYTLSASSVAKAGAAPATGRHLYIRVVALNGSRQGSTSRLVATTARPPAPATVGTPLRIASFNIRSAKYDGDDKRKWLERAPGVAAQILSTQPGIVAIQEATSGSSGGPMRQTESLQAELIKADPAMARYTITRTTAYNPPGLHGSQAARIVYDSSRYALLSDCQDLQPDGSHWNRSCSLELPILPGDSTKWQRTAAFARFVDLSTGKTFLVVSAHLDYRHSHTASLERSYNKLRTQQAQAIWSFVNAPLPDRRQNGEPVIVAGDFNASQADAEGDGAHDYLVSQGLYDTAGALSQVHVDLPSLNHFDKTLRADPTGYARRVDQVLVSGAAGASKFKVVTKAVDAKRNSDHAMVYADIVFPSA